MVADPKPAKLFDLGCNSGDYSQTAIEAGAKVGKRGRIVETEELSPGGRLPVGYDRR